MDDIVRIIEAGAWPLAFILSLLIFRKPIIELLPYLKRLKYKELELEFGRRLEDISKRSQESLQRTSVEPAEETEVDYYLEQVKSLSPRTAILESWLALESTAISTAQHFKLTPGDKRIMFPTALRALKEGNVLTDQDIALINDLRALRNKATHELDFYISEKEAATFMEVARNQSDIIASEAWGRYGGE